MNRFNHTPIRVNTHTYAIRPTTLASNVAPTMPLPAPVRIAAATIGMSVIGATSVPAANAAPTTIGQRSIGRSHRYTSVLSSRRSPMAAPANTSDTIGSTRPRPTPATSRTASSSDASALPSAKPEIGAIIANSVSPMMRDRLVSWRSTTRYVNTIAASGSTCRVDRGDVAVIGPPRDT